MIYNATNYTQAPPTVWLEPLADGTTNVWMTRNTTQRDQPLEGNLDGGATICTTYESDTAFFNTPNAVTQEEIAQNADSWWTFAESWQRQPVPTIEQRLTDAEAAIVALMGV